MKALPADNPGRVTFLDGLRGFACVQVLLSHFVDAFYPGVAWQNPLFFRYGREVWLVQLPVYFFFDGYIAVCIFFLISGAALTYSFAAMPRAVVKNIARRVIRLGLPVAASVVLAYILFQLFPEANLRASQIADMRWLSFAAPNVSLGQVAADIFANGLLLGYRDNSLFAGFPPLASFLQPGALSLNGPLWTMHLEFYGSILIIVLMACRSVNVWLYRALLAASVMIWIVHPMILFVLGHLCADLIKSRRMQKWLALRSVQLFSAALIVAGILEVAYRDPPFVEAIGRFFWPKTVFHSFDLQAQHGAILVFAGVICCQPVRTWLAGGLFKGLGRISYSLYLVHLPVLYTVVSMLICVLYGRISYGALTVLMLGAELSISLGVAVLFTRWVDRPAIALSRAVAETKTRKPKTAA